jgi:NDP-sugar pyrophosphorylase family protein
MSSVVITMAGFGRRFADAGYTVPKYMIEARGHTLFWWSLIGLSHLFADNRFVFVVRAADAASQFIRSACREIGVTDYTLVELDAPTNGQATTARLALGECASEQPFAIFNIDTHVHPDRLGTPPAGCDGWIPCFEAPGDHWSFVRLGPDGRAVEVREKKRISPYATIGYYWFRSAQLYADLYDSYYARSSDRLERGEAYVAPLYNELIARDGDVRITRLPTQAVDIMGTPAELKRFKIGASA